MDPAAVAVVVEDLVGPVVAAEGLELFDVRLAGGSLQVFVDRPGAGVDLETVSRVTRLVSALLDEHDPLPGRYTLEVSSPGLERRLRRPDHFSRYVGSEVKVKLRAGAAGERRAAGRLEAADAEGIVVAGRRLAYADIESARTVFDWDRGAAPAGASR